MDTHVVILAAGQGTRMRSKLPKVLQPLAGRPLLAHVLGVAESLQPAAVHVVFGHGGEQVRAAFSGAGVNWVLQSEQKGTGHALAQAMPAIPDTARVLVLYGDVPLMSGLTLQGLLAEAGEGLGVLSVRLAEPRGYGRILRDEAGCVQGIVEEKDASLEQRAITEVNTGILCGPAAALRGWLTQLRCDNAQGEYYLTDCVAASVAQGKAVQAVLAEDEAETLGVNDRVQLAQLERILQRRQANQHMAQGLRLADPERFDLRGELTHGADCFIDINCVLSGGVSLGAGVEIGPNCVLQDVEIGDGCRIEANSHLDGAVVERDCQVGPYARLRPGTMLAAQAKVGNFVETKKTRVGEGSKINHLSYIGDATLGAGVNVGAGTITCNYDGVNKHQTIIGDGAFIGSNSALVAPVKIGAGATIGAGSVVSKEAAADALTLTRAKQRSLPHWQRPKKQHQE